MRQRSAQTRPQPLAPRDLNPIEVSCRAVWDIFECYGDCGAEIGSRIPADVFINAYREHMQYAGLARAPALDALDKLEAHAVMFVDRNHTVVTLLAGWYELCDVFAPRGERQFWTNFT